MAIIYWKFIPIMLSMFYNLMSDFSLLEILMKTHSAINY